MALRTTSTKCAKNQQEDSMFKVVYDINDMVVDFLDLKSVHKEGLNNRGLTDSQIELQQYRSLTILGHKSLRRELMKKFSDRELLQHKAFYLEDGRLKMAFCSGLLIPIRDPNKRIRGFSCKSDNPEFGKYIHFSSSKNELANYRVYLHFPLREVETENTRILGVEGILSADICAVDEKYGKSEVIGLLGVGMQGHFSERAIELGLEVDLAFDQDYETKPQVFTPFYNCAMSLFASGIETNILGWDQVYKGIDDAMLAQADIRSAGLKDFFSRFIELGEKLSVKTDDLKQIERAMRFVNVLSSNPSFALSEKFTDTMAWLRAYYPIEYNKYEAIIKNTGDVWGKIRTILTSKYNKIQKKKEEENKLNPHKLVESFVKFNGYTFVYRAPFNYWYRDSCFQRIPDDYLASLLVKYLKKTGLGSYAKGSFVSNSVLNIKGLNPFSEERISPFLINPVIDEEMPKLSSMVNCLNGYISLDLNGEGIKLYPHSKNIFTTSTLGAPYIDNQTSQKFEGFLQMMLPFEEDRKLVQEWFGYCLLPGNEYQKCLILKGDGANGKSVLLYILKLLLGSANVSSVGMDAFDTSKRFLLCKLKDKLADISNEFSSGKAICESTFKRFVSGDSVTAEEKNIRAFDFKPEAKIIFATNDDPQFKDRSSGLWRRLCIINCDNIVPESNRNPKMLMSDYWEEELPGILNWAIEGRRRLFSQNGFSEEKSKKIVAGYKQDASFPEEWLLENVVSDCEKNVSSSDLYEKYVTSSKKAHILVLNQNQFNRVVLKIFPKSRKTKNAKKMSSGERRVLFEGISFKD